MAVAEQAIRDQQREPYTGAPDPARLTGSEIMCQALLAEGVDILFGYPGGAIMPFYDALHGCPELRHILVRHEQGAAHAADGYARATGKVGVVVATSGPGATNLVTGIANAYMDSVPMVAITGQVSRPSIGKDSFQETDVIGVTISITKHNILVGSIEELGPAIHEAFAIARSGRPGPVVVDVPKDVQFELTTYEPPERRDLPRPMSMHADRQVQEAARMLNAARTPLIIAGHGVILSAGYAALRALAEKSGVPVITTLLGISCFPESHPLCLGMPGMHGAASTNRAIDEADVLFAVGMRFDDRITGKVSEFAPNAKIIHVDIEEAELHKVVPTALAIHGDARETLERLLPLVDQRDHSEWLGRIRSWERPQTVTSEPYAQPTDILAAIKRVTNGEATIVSDVGQHQMWTARHYGYDRPNSHFTSGGAGTMGFGLPAAMGVKFGRPDEQVWVVAGDGGIQMNIQELATLADFGIELKVVIMNNGYLGMVRQWQKFFHGGRYSSTPITSPDYTLLAAAYGHKARHVDHAHELDEAMRWAAETPGTVILDVAIECERNVYPMIPSGHAVGSMIEDPRWSDNGE